MSSIRFLKVSQKTTSPASLIFISNWLDFPSFPEVCILYRYIISIRMYYVYSVYYTISIIYRLLHGIFFYINTRLNRYFYIISFETMFKTDSINWNFSNFYYNQLSLYVNTKNIGLIKTQGTKFQILKFWRWI